MREYWNLCYCIDFSATISGRILVPRSLLLQIAAMKTYLRAALPMLLNAFFCFMIHRDCGIGHEFGLGACFGGSIVLALRDAEKACADAKLGE